MLTDTLRDLIESTTITNLRTIMAQDTDYPYVANNDQGTGCLILSEFPDSTAPWKVPEIVVGQATYTLNQQTLFNNLIGQVTDPGTGAVTGYRYGLSVPFAIPISVISSIKDESARLAAGLAQYCHFFYLRLFVQQGLRIWTAQVGQTVPRAQMPVPRFETVVGLGGQANWIVTVSAGAGTPILQQVTTTQEIYIDSTQAPIAVGLSGAGRATSSVSGGASVG